MDGSSQVGVGVGNCCFDLEFGSLGKLGHCDGRSAGRQTHEELGVNGIHLREVVHALVGGKRTVR